MIRMRSLFLGILLEAVGIVLVGCATDLPAQTFDGSRDVTNDSDYKDDLSQVTSAIDHLVQSQSDQDNYIAGATKLLRDYYLARDNVETYSAALAGPDADNQDVDNRFDWANAVIGAVGAAIGAYSCPPCGYLAASWDIGGITYQKARLKPHYLDVAAKFRSDKADADKLVPAVRDSFWALVHESDISKFPADFNAWRQAVLAADDSYRELLGAGPTSIK